jgi:GNAT superfamily N-acetyltransferase
VLRITEESVTANIDQAAPLLRAHWEEIARNKDLMVLKPNVAVYAALEAQDLLICLVARDGDNLVGYCVSILTRGHLHYAELTTAVNDVIYVDPAYRGASRLGLKLIAETERLAKERGAQMVLWHAKEHTALAAVLPRLGYEVQDVVYARGV